MRASSVGENGPRPIVSLRNLSGCPAAAIFPGSGSSRKGNKDENKKGCGFHRAMTKSRINREAAY